ncbi:MAG: D-tyrosyl-tRNA(Tyr) deacylase [Saprospiraceae bacterium]|nr:D-tyrosyl-tRNA(Tyr) deacylase [Saprospiraceae bacterium]
MRVVVQRVKQASVEVENKEIASIENGLLILVGIENDDREDDLTWLIVKITQMRIFNDEKGLMNRSITDIGGAFLVVSQFTLHASTKKGNRPSFIRAAKPDFAIPFYEKFIENLAKTSGLSVKKGQFGADMKVALVNDGPVTIVIDTKTVSSTNIKE